MLQSTWLPDHFPLSGEGFIVYQHNCCTPGQGIPYEPGKDGGYTIIYRAEIML